MGFAFAIRIERILGMCNTNGVGIAFMCDWAR